MVFETFTATLAAASVGNASIIRRHNGNYTGPASANCSCAAAPTVTETLTVIPSGCSMIVAPTSVGAQDVSQSGDYVVSTVVVTETVQPSSQGIVHVIATDYTAVTSAVTMQRSSDSIAYAPSTDDSASPTDTVMVQDFSDSAVNAPSTADSTLMAYPTTTQDVSETFVLASSSSDLPSSTEIASSDVVYITEIDYTTVPGSTVTVVASSSETEEQTTTLTSVLTSTQTEFSTVPPPLDISATSSSSLPVGPADTPSSNDVQPPSTTSYFLGFESPSSAVSSVVQTTSSLSSGPSSGAYISYPTSGSPFGNSTSSAGIMESSFVYPAPSSTLLSSQDSSMVTPSAPVRATSGTLTVITQTKSTVEMSTTSLPQSSQISSAASSLSQSSQVSSVAPSLSTGTSSAPAGSSTSGAVTSSKSASSSTMVTSSKSVASSQSVASSKSSAPCDSSMTSSVHESSSVPTASSTALAGSGSSTVQSSTKASSTVPTSSQASTIPSSTLMSSKASSTVASSELSVTFVYNTGFLVSTTPVATTSKSILTVVPVNPTLTDSMGSHIPQFSSGAAAHYRRDEPAPTDAPSYRTEVVRELHADMTEHWRVAAGTGAHKQATRTILPSHRSAAAVRRAQHPHTVIDVTDELDAANDLQLADIQTVNTRSTSRSSTKRASSTRAQATQTPDKSSQAKPSSAKQSTTRKVTSSSTRSSSAGATPTASEGAHCPYPYPGEHCGGNGSMTTLVSSKTSSQTGSQAPKSTGSDCPYPGQEC